MKKNRDWVRVEVTGEGLGEEEVLRAWASKGRLRASILFLFSSNLLRRLSSYDSFGTTIFFFFFKLVNQMDLSFLWERVIGTVAIYEIY